MLLTGDQVRTLAELSDGAAVTVNKIKGDKNQVRVRRGEDGLEVLVNAFGVVTQTIQEADDAEA